MFYLMISCFVDYQNLLVISILKSLISIVVIKFHESFGHVGSKKCISILREFFIFSNMDRVARNLLSRCGICQRTKPSNQRVEGLMQHVVSNNVLDKLLVDLYGPLPVGWNGVQYVFVVLDNLSRFVRLYPLKKATALAALNCIFNDYIPSHDRPVQIVSDHGSQFSSKLWQSRLKESGVIPTHTSVYHPKSNPSERVMRELGRFFRT